MRVHIDPFDSKFEDVPSLRAILRDGSAIAEVQIASVNGALTIIIAGDAEQDRDPRGNLRVRVYPTE